MDVHVNDDFSRSPTAGKLLNDAELNTASLRSKEREAGHFLRTEAFFMPLSQTSRVDDVHISDENVDLHRKLYNCTALTASHDFPAFGAANRP